MRVKLFALIPLIAAAAACTGTSPDYRYYSLSDGPPVTIPGDAERIIVQVGPVFFPEYLNRPQIVTQTGASNYRFAEYDRWAEPLQRSFMRRLATDLAAELNSPWVYEFGGANSNARQSQFQVLVTVQHFDADAKGNARLNVQWGLDEPVGTKIILARRDHYETKMQGSGYAAQAEAMTALIGMLSKDIAEEISRRLPDVDQKGAAPE